MTSKLLEEKYREALRELSVSNKDNMMCVDCMSKKKTTFVVFQFQSYICEMCADVHRTYGHRGVKQIGLSNFTKEEVEEMRQGGNQKVKATWYGGKYDQIVRPNPDLCASDREFKEKAKEHIKKVYIQRLYKSSSGTTPGNVGSTTTTTQQPTNIGSSSTNNNQQPPQSMPYNNVQYNNGGIDTRNRGASLNSTQYANLKTTNSSSIIQSSNINGINSGNSVGNKNNSSSEDLISFGGNTAPSQPTMNVLNNFNQPSYGQPSQPSYNNYPTPNNANQGMPMMNNNYNQGMPMMNNMQYGNQPMGYGYNNNMMNNNYSNNNNGYGYNNGMMMNNGNMMNQNYGQQPQYNMNNQNYGYGQPQQQPPMNNMNNNRPQVYSPPLNNNNNNYGMTTPNVNTRQSPSNNNPMGYNNQYGTPMTPNQPPSQPSTITPVNPYVGTSPRGNVPSSVPTNVGSSPRGNVPTPPPSTLGVSTPSRSASMPPKSTPPSFGSSTNQPPSFVSTQPKQPTQPIVQPPKKQGLDMDAENLSKQFNKMSVSSTSESNNVKPPTTSTVPKSTPLSFGSSTSTTSNEKPAGVTGKTGVLVGSTKNIDSSEFEKATTTGVNIDDLRGNASKDNIKFKEINPNRVIPMKQTTEWQ